MNELAELANVAGPTITSLMVTDTWQALRAKLIALWQRVMPDQSATITSDLDALQATVAAAHVDQNHGATEAAQQNLRQRIAWLLMQDPTAAGELRQLLSQPRAAAATHIQNASQSGDRGVMYVAGGDLTINR